MGLVKDYDGEFWMSIEDFKSSWGRLEVCQISMFRIMTRGVFTLIDNKNFG